MSVVDCNTGYENHITFGLTFKDYKKPTEDGKSANGRVKHPNYTTQEQLLVSKIILRAIDDALKEPITKAEERKANYNITSRRIATRTAARNKLYEIESRQTAIDFVMGDAFLGLYRYAFKGNGERLQQWLVKAIESIRKKRSRSLQYRKIFNDMVG